MSAITAATANKNLDFFPSTGLIHDDVVLSSGSIHSIAMSGTIATGSSPIIVINTPSRSYYVDGTSDFRMMTPTSTAVTISGLDTYTGLLNTTHYGYAATCNIKHMVKSAMKSNLLIKVNSRQKPLQTTAQVEEQRARCTLRDMLSEQDWRRYVTNGFIMVKGSSDYWYQIFAKGGINVYRHGKKVHYICIHTDDKCPPTDHVINMKLLVEFDEMTIWKGGNVRNITNGTELVFHGNSINMNLLEHYGQLKKFHVSRTPTATVFSCDDGILSIAC